MRGQKEHGVPAFFAGIVDFKFLVFIFSDTAMFLSFEILSILRVELVCTFEPRGRVKMGADWSII